MNDPDVTVISGRDETNPNNTSLQDLINGSDHIGGGGVGKQIKLDTARKRNQRVFPLPVPADDSLNISGDATQANPYPSDFPA